MAQRTAIVFSRPFAVRGLALAEQRLAYLTELYDSGRWRRFHDEADFLFNVREAKAAVESWRRLAAPDTQWAAPSDPGPMHGHGGDVVNGGWRETVAPSSRHELASAALLPAVGFSADGVGAETDLSKAS